MTNHTKTIGIDRPKISNHLKNNPTPLQLENEAELKAVLVSGGSVENQSAVYVNVEGVLFRNVDFRGARLGSLELTDVRFENCDLSNADFSGAIIHRTEFVDCKMLGMKLCEATLQNVAICGCNGQFGLFNMAEFKRAQLEDSHFHNSNFQNCKLTKVTFRACDFHQCQMSGTSLTGMDLRDSNVDGLGVRLEDLCGAVVSPMQAVGFSKLLGLVVKS